MWRGLARGRGRRTKTTRRRRAFGSRAAGTTREPRDEIRTVLSSPSIFARSALNALTTTLSFLRSSSISAWLNCPMLRDSSSFASRCLEKPWSSSNWPDAPAPVPACAGGKPSAWADIAFGCAACTPRAHLYPPVHPAAGISNFPEQRSNQKRKNLRGFFSVCAFRIAGTEAFRNDGCDRRARAWVRDSRKKTRTPADGASGFFREPRRRTNLARKPSQPDEDGAFAASHVMNKPRLRRASSSVARDARAL